MKTVEQVQEDLEFAYNCQSILKNLTHAKAQREWPMFFKSIGSLCSLISDIPTEQYQLSPHELFEPVIEEYEKKIKALCAERGIQL